MHDSPLLQNPGKNVDNIFKKYRCFVARNELLWNTCFQYFTLILHALEHNNKIQFVFASAARDACFYCLC